MKIRIYFIINDLDKIKPNMVTMEEMHTPCFNWVSVGFYEFLL